MLDHLDVKHGHSVLEIGTGTGFSAALLSEIVGASGCVTIVEIDRQVAETACDRLAGFDRVRTVLGDATTGTFESAPFDRVISTASVHLGRVPYRWVQQTKPGGVIVIPVRADLTSGPLVRFIVNGNGSAIGRIVPMGVQFMEVRSQPTAGTPDDDFDWQDDTADHTATTMKPWLMFSDIVSRWALAVALPSCRYNMKENEFTGSSVPVMGLRSPGRRQTISGSPEGYSPPVGRGRERLPLVDRSRKPVGSDWVWSITPKQQTIQLGVVTGSC